MTRNAGDDAYLREESQCIEELLEHLSTLVAPAAWARIEELVARLVQLYGAGLERVLAHAATAGTASELESRLCADELVSSLLVLHGLHPRPLAARVEDALAEVRPYVESHAGTLELLGVEDSGVVRLRMGGTCGGCPSSAATLDGAIRRALEAAAPEVTRIEVEGLAQPEAKVGLVQLGTGREAGS